MRLQSVLASVLLASCTIQTQPAPQQPQYVQQPQPEPVAQQQPAPPPEQPAYQPPPPPQQPQPPPQQVYQAPPPPQVVYQPEQPWTPPPPPTEQTPPPDYDDPVYDDDNSVQVAGDSVPNVDVFYDQLDPYGTWYDDPTYGYVFTPSQQSYVPYSNGHWKYTDAGLLWVSNDPYGWATDHYGRWVYQNRWVWVPDTTWGPAWVTWRQSDGWVGWAPSGFSNDAYVPEDHWRFVRAPDMFAVDVNRRYVGGRAAQLHRRQRRDRSLSPPRQ